MKEARKTIQSKTSTTRPFIKELNHRAFCQRVEAQGQAFCVQDARVKEGSFCWSV